MEDKGSARLGRLRSLRDARPVLRLAEGSTTDLTLAELGGDEGLVVIKALRPGFVDDRHARRRLRDVADALTRVVHPHLVRALPCASPAGDEPTLVMEYLLGHSLRKELVGRSRLPASEAIQLVLEAALGLAAAHGGGVTHGKLDLDDLFLVPQPSGVYTVKLLGFGAADGRDGARVDVMALGGILEALLQGTDRAAGLVDLGAEPPPEAALSLARRAGTGQLASAAAFVEALEAYVLGLDDAPTLMISTHTLITPKAWSAEPLLQVGQVFERFEVRELIGSGFMGEVYEVSHPHRPQLFALKCLRLEHSADPDKVERSMAEAEVMLRMDHANIVRVHDAGISEHRIVWMLMDRLRGRTLRELCAKVDLSLRSALYIAEEIAWGLDYAHEFSVIHRDIKPDNVFVTTDARVIVLDLGLGKFIPYDLPGTARVRPMGSVAYAAPEQLAGALSDGRFDIYSLGMVLHEMLLGEHPYADVLEDPLALGHAQLTRPLPSLAARGLPEYIDRLIDRLAAKDPSARCFTAAEAAKALRATRARLEADVDRGVLDDPGYGLASMRPVHRSEPTATALPVAPRRARYRSALTAVGLLLALILGAACALLLAE